MDTFSYECCYCRADLNAFFCLNCFETIRFRTYPFRDLIAYCVICLLHCKFTCCINVSFTWLCHAWPIVWVLKKVLKRVISHSYKLMLLFNELCFCIVNIFCDVKIVEFEFDIEFNLFIKRIKFLQMFTYK